MGKADIDKIVIKLPMLKLCRFYHMFDPNSAKIFNRNVSQVLFIVYIAFTLSMVLFGQLGFITNNDEKLSNIDMVLLMFSYAHYYLSLVKITVFLYNSKKVWNMFDVAHLDFLTSKHCRKNINMLYDCRDLIIKVTSILTFILLTLIIQWLLVPLVMNAIDDTVSSRNQNILNLRFPVSIHTYNQYYVIFYLIELMVLSLNAYTLILCDMFIMSFCWEIIVLYQIVTKSITDVGYTNKLQSEHYEDFKSILNDQRKLHLKLKALHDIIRPFMLMYVGLSLCLIITITCVLITGDLVNIALYSTNWTMMDLKFKNLLLMAMRLNDANRVELKASPNKIINLQLFANLLKVCYNCISVMLKTMQNE